MSDDERAIRELVETWMEASRAGDTTAVLELMTDDVVFMVPGHEPFGKEEFRQNSEMMRDVRLDGNAEIREIEVAGVIAHGSGTTSRSPSRSQMGGRSAEAATR